MNVQPFSYGMTVIADYDNGDILKEEILTISPETILGAFSKGVMTLAALSLASGYIVEPAVPHLIQNAFKNVAAVGLESGYKFKEIENAGKGPAPAAVSAPAATSAKPAEKAPVKEEEAPKEEEADFDMGDLFGW